MAWEAIHCETDVGRDAVASVICETLGVDAADLSIGDRIDVAHQDAKVLVAARPCNGEFVLTIDIITSDEALAEKLDAAAIRSMIERWGCRALLSNSDNPYLMVLITPGQPEQSVYVDSEAFDAREELIIRGPASEQPNGVPDAPPSRRRPTSAPPASRENEDED
jgi:hypothetical protein